MMRTIFTNQHCGSMFRPHDLLLRCYIWGINVNDQNSIGMTVLHYATKYNSLQSVHLLLWLGANPIITDYQCRAPFHYALDNGNKPMARLLVVPWEKSQKMDQFSLMQNLKLYLRSLRYNSVLFFSELRYWIGLLIIIIQLGSKF